MAKKRKPSTNSRLTTKATTSAPMLIKAPTGTVATTAPTEVVTKAPTGVVATTANSEIIVDRDAIAQRAFSKFLARGCAHGHALEDWLAAEAELRTLAAR